MIILLITNGAIWRDYDRILRVIVSVFAYFICFFFIFFAKSDEKKNKFCTNFYILLNQKSKIELNSHLTIQLPLNYSLLLSFVPFEMADMAEWAHASWLIIESTITWLHSHLILSICYNYSTNNNLSLSVVAIILARQS